MPLDGPFDCLISTMNRRNIARLSNGFQSPITLVCSAPCALLTSPAWGFFSSLKREVSSHPLNVRYLISVLGIGAFLITSTWGVLLACFGFGACLITYMWGFHLAYTDALLTSSAWGVSVIWFLIPSAWVNRLLLLPAWWLTQYSS